MTEEWRPIAGYESWYEVSNIGRVKRVMDSRGTYADRILTPTTNHAYLQVIFYRDETRVARTVHRLVAEAFIGPCPIGLEVNHKDGDKMNNVAENLEYMTRRENAQHAARMGFMARGPRQHSCKLTEPQALEIFALRGAMSQRQVARLYSVNRTTIARIWNGTTWSWLTGRSAGSEAAG